MSSVRVVVALLVLLALQLVPGVGVGAAFAAGTGPCYSFGGCNREEAYNYAKARADAAVAGQGGICVAAGGGVITDRVVYLGGSNYYQAKIICHNPTYGSDYESYPGGSWYFGACPVGTTWNETTHTCFDPSECLNKEPIGSSFVNSVTDVTCVDGCEFKAPGGNTISVEIPSTGFVSTTVSGWTPTGNVCPSGAPPPGPEKPQDCAPVDGQTMCVKPDGRHCASASTGRQICWRAGETGEKVDGGMLQKRNSGVTPIAPSTPPPDGDSFVPSGSPIQENTSVGGVTFGTTMQNYATAGGVSAGGSAPDAGENSDGSQGGSDLNAGDDGKDGSASGGEGCESPPVCSGDPVNCGVLDQVWRNRCSGNGNKVADGGCSPAGTVAAFSCSGDEILCKQALIAKEQQCKADKASGDIALDNADGDGGDDGFQLSDLWHSEPGQELDGNLVSMQGGDLFPEVEFAPGQVFKTPDALPDLLTAIRWLVIAAFMVAAAFIAGGV